MYLGKKVVVIMPAYNVERTLEETYHDLPLDMVDEVILTDDGSRDRTSEIAMTLDKVKVFRHPHNLGYGASQKTCYREALKIGADIIVMVHPDHQYDPRVLPKMIEPLAREECDAVFGSRMLGGRFFEGGMPRWKFAANVILTALTNLTLGIYLTETHTGFRAYSWRYLNDHNFERNSNDFVFDTEIILQGIHRGMKFLEIPISTRYFKEASQMSFLSCVRYGLAILRRLLWYRLHRMGVIRWSLLGSFSGPSGEQIHHSLSLPSSQHRRGTCACFDRYTAGTETQESKTTGFFQPCLPRCKSHAF